MPPCTANTRSTRRRRWPASFAHCWRDMTTTVDIASEVIALERAALDRWGAGDPAGYAEIFDDGMTYFDPFQERRLDDHEPRELMRSVTGQIRVDRYDMQGARVQCFGDVALLSFNLVSYRSDGGQERAISSWNATE